MSKMVFPIELIGKLYLTPRFTVLTSISAFPRRVGIILTGGIAIAIVIPIVSTLTIISPFFLTTRLLVT